VLFEHLKALHLYLHYSFQVIVLLRTPVLVRAVKKRAEEDVVIAILLILQLSVLLLEAQEGICLDEGLQKGPVFLRVTLNVRPQLVLRDLLLVLHVHHTLPKLFLYLQLSAIDQTLNGFAPAEE